MMATAPGTLPHPTEAVLRRQFLDNLAYDVTKQCNSILRELNIPQPKLVKVDHVKELVW